MEGKQGEMATVASNIREMATLHPVAMEGGDREAQMGLKQEDADGKGGQLCE